jgi:NAD+ synthase (glutamine-hydrolysing)
MRLVKIGLANVNTTVGAMRTNVDRALAIVEKMHAEQVTIGVFQEQLIAGYPCEDLVQWHAFMDAQWRELERLAEKTAHSRTVFCVGVGVAIDAHRYNAAAVLHAGKILGVVPKEKLPTYNVFYEMRTYTRGSPGLRAALPNGVPFGDHLFRFDWGTLGVEICEDLWTPDGPMRRRCYQGAELIANLSASPFRLGVLSTRREMGATRSGDNQCTLVYTNQIGGQDGLIFDGGGFVHQNGRVAFERERFVEGYSAVTVDLDRTRRLRAENTTWRHDALRFTQEGEQATIVSSAFPGADRSGLKYPVPATASFFLPTPLKPERAPVSAPGARAAFCEEMLSALALGLGDYFEKNRFKVIGVALSGGRDSLLALLIAWRYLKGRYGEKGAGYLRTFYMPTRFSSDNTKNGAEEIAAEIGAPFSIISIEDAFARELEAAKSMLQAGENITPITEQNIQARLRGTRMWNWANATGGMFLQTGNMSERAMGYTTIGGDLEGALGVISNIPKTVVMYLLDYLRETTGFKGIDTVLSHPAGPELAANQEGEKELMPFPMLDACFALYAGEKMSPDEVKTAMESLFPDVARDRINESVDRFARLFSQSIYKWVQAPLGLHVGNLDLDRERALQLPVVQSLEWTK